MFDIPSKKVNFVCNDLEVYEEVIFFSEQKHVCDLVKYREKNLNNPNIVYLDIKIKNKKSQRSVS